MLIYVYSMLILTRVTRRVSHVEQKLIILPEHIRLSPFLSGFRIARSLVFCVLFCRTLFVFFLLDIMLSILLLYLRFLIIRFGIFKLSPKHQTKIIVITSFSQFKIINMIDQYIFLNKSNNTCLYPSF
jgi:hypothetical protein